MPCRPEGYRIEITMVKHSSPRRASPSPTPYAIAVAITLLVSMMANMLGWSFNGDVFSHELDHGHHHDHHFSADPSSHLAAHQDALTPDDHLDAATHLSLHATGQYQPFFFASHPSLAPALAGAHVLAAFVSPFIPESIPEFLLRPPRFISARWIS